MSIEKHRQIIPHIDSTKENSGLVRINRQR
nr:MAG TPA: hypothetical protein [Bacteriophage sp.]